MQKRSFLKFAVLFFGSISAPASAQVDWDVFFAPRLGQQALRLNYGLTRYSEEAVAGTAATASRTDQRVGMVVPLRQDADREWLWVGQFAASDLATAASLPGTAVAVPGPLYQIDFGPLVRYRLDNGWIMGGNFLAGSQSDRLFHSRRELSLSGNLLLQIPRGRDAWFFLLNYANDRDFLNNWPFPGLAYFYAPSDSFQALLGLPLYARYAPHPLYEISVSYIPLLQVTLKQEVSLGPRAAFDVTLAMTNEQYKRAGRTSRQDLLFVEQKEIGAGLTLVLPLPVVLGLRGGYSFDRVIFEGKDLLDRHRCRLDLGDAVFVGIEARISLDGPPPAPADGGAGGSPNV